MVRPDKSVNLKQNKNELKLFFGKLRRNNLLTSCVAGVRWLCRGGVGVQRDGI